MSNLKIFAKTVDEKAMAQINAFLAQEPFKDCKVRIMPDVHAGAGCVIGFTANLGDKVIPNIVGVDIGCGMLTVMLGNRNIDYAKLDEVIKERIPSGMNVHGYATCDVSTLGLRCYDELRNIPHLNASMGTLGGGNHFIEIDEDDAGEKYLVIHTGSRNLGKQVAEIYQQKAVQRLCNRGKEKTAIIQRYKQEGRESEIQAALKALQTPKIPKELAYLEGSDADDYLHDMRLCLKFATSNRMAIAREILYGMNLTLPSSYFETIHNYIDEGGMVRKGAIAARTGQEVLIPLNMRDGCIIGIGKGNKDWNYSAPHGAGRVMSRMAAKADIALADFTSAMEGIYTTTDTAATIDEAHHAHKPAAELIDMVADTDEIVRIIKPRYNYKVAENKSRGDTNEIIVQQLPHPLGRSRNGTVPSKAGNLRGWR